MQPDDLTDSNDYWESARVEAIAEQEAEGRHESACIQACINFNDTHGFQRTGAEYLCLCGYHRDGPDDRVTEEHRNWMAGEIARILDGWKHERDEARCRAEQQDREGADY